SFPLRYPRGSRFRRWHAVKRPVGAPARLHLPHHGVACGRPGACIAGATTAERRAAGACTTSDDSTAVPARQPCGARAPATATPHARGRVEEHRRILDVAREQAAAIA